jgi:hypothetical protein
MVFRIFHIFAPIFLARRPLTDAETGTEILFSFILQWSRSRLSDKPCMVKGMEEKIHFVLIPLTAIPLTTPPPVSACRPTS